MYYIYVRTRTHTHTKILDALRQKLTITKLVKHQKNRNTTKSQALSADAVPACPCAGMCVCMCVCVLAHTTNHVAHDLRAHAKFARRTWFGGGGRGGRRKRLMRPRAR